MSDLMKLRLDAAVKVLNSEHVNRHDATYKAAEALLIEMFKLYETKPKVNESVDRHYVGTYIQCKDDLKKYVDDMLSNGIMRFKAADGTDYDIPGQFQRLDDLEIQIKGLDARVDLSITNSENHIKALYERIQSLEKANLIQTDNLVSLREDTNRKLGAIHERVSSVQERVNVRVTEHRDLARRVTSLEDRLICTGIDGTGRPMYMQVKDLKKPEPPRKEAQDDMGNVFDVRLLLQRMDSSENYVKQGRPQ